MVESRDTALQNKVKWLILVRLLLTTVFFSVGHIILAVDKEYFYILIAFVYLISVIYSVWLVRKRSLRLLTAIQVLIDVMIVTTIVQLTGGIESLYTMLYVLSILSAGVIISGSAGIITAVIIGVFYVGSNVLTALDLSPILHICITREHPIDIVLYTSYVHVVTFILISILLSSLMRRISRMENVVRLKEHLALVGEVSAEIAHEIRNPLTSISGSVELLDERMKDKLAEDDHRLLGVIVDETDRVARIFDQFLDYAKLSKGEFSSVNIHTVLDELIYTFEHNKRINTSAKIIKEYGEGALDVVCDKHKIRQVFSNIMNNALQVMTDGGELRIGVRQQHRSVEISFKDTGPGMKPELLKRIFAPFESSKHQGLGLGLTIASRIVEMHGGRIHVDTKLGEGSTFTVTIPCS